MTWKRHCEKSSVDGDVSQSDLGVGNMGVFTCKNPLMLPSFIGN